MSIRWRIILLVMLGAVVSFLAGLAVTVVNARIAVQVETQAALAAARAQPALAGSGRHLLRQFVPDGQAAPASLPPRSDVPGWFADLIWMPGPPVRVQDSGGFWLLTPDPADEVAEIWDDTSALAQTGLTVLGLLLLSLHLLLTRTLAPLEGFGVALDRLARGLPTGPETAATTPELAAIGHRIVRLDQALAAARAENAALSHSLIALQDRERADLARDLHDELGPLLFGIRVDAHAITSAAGRGGLSPEEAAARADSVVRAAAAIRALSRRILNRLRPMGLDHLPALSVITDLMQGLAHQHPCVHFHHELDPAAFGRSEATDLTLYRLAQEALLNAVRHGQPTRVDLTVVAGPTSIELCVRDNGGGLSGPPGHGITGMHERVRALGGHLQIATQADGCTRVHARLPAPTPQTERATLHG